MKSKVCTKLKFINYHNLARGFIPCGRLNQVKASDNKLSPLGCRYCNRLDTHNFAEVATSERQGCVYNNLTCSNNKFSKLLSLFLGSHVINCTVSYQKR